jgi:hypothetical protein
MNSTAALPAPIRSEAFAEDLCEVEPLSAPPEPTSLRWALTLVPLAVVVVGVAFAVMPPLA